MASMCSPWPPLQVALKVKTDKSRPSEGAMSKGPHVLVHLNSENSWHDLPGLKLWVADVVVPHRKEVM